MSTFSRSRSQAFQLGLASRFIFSQLRLLNALYQHFDRRSDYSHNINFHGSDPEMSRSVIRRDTFARVCLLRAEGARRMETKRGVDKRR